MRGLIQLFAAYGGIILFFVLEALSITLIIQFNHRQGDIARNSWMLLTAYIDKQADELTDYIGLKEEVIRLQAKNIKLMEELDNARYSNIVLRDSLKQDSLIQAYSFVEANVISNSIIGSNNYLRLNRGRRHGIRPHMGVIGDDGIIGIIRSTTEHFSLAMSVLHSQARINASIKSRGYFGTLTWDGQDPLFMQLNAIPRYAEFKEGDTVLTNGYSQIFPEGIMIGTIKEFKEEQGSNFFNIQVRLHNDLARARNVYIVDNLMREEHEQLDRASDD